MKNPFSSLTPRGWIAVAVSLALVGVATSQIREAIKIIGVGAAVKQFGPDMNKAVNRLSGHKDTALATTKVVPILTVGLNKSGAIGAAQVTGPRDKVSRVQAVAQPTADLFGREIRVNALIPVSSIDVTKGIKRVEGVGVSGIIDLKL